VDLFCGAAGLSLGLKNSGIPIVVGIDLDPAYRYPFETNIGARFLEQMFPACRRKLLTGCLATPKPGFWQDALRANLHSLQFD
jgi:site-specific DNA-cytosine methylase